MKNVRYIIAVLVLFVCSQLAVAQTALSSYFLEGMLYNSKINPAMKAERGYLALPVSNISLATKGNVGISNFLYPRGEDELATFMSGSVSAEEFLDRIPDNTKFALDLDETILGFGFRMFGGYASFGLSVHSSVAASLPKGFFEFAKKGLSEDSYSFSGLNINTTNYAAATIGYSHGIFKGFRLGVNFKYLMGLAHADILVDKMNVELSGDRWMIESHAQMQAALFCGANLKKDENNVINGVDINLNPEEIMSLPTSNGYAFDFGFVYDMNHFVPGLTLSASVVDLGSITWKNMVSAHSTDAKVEFNGFGEVDYNNVENVVEAEFDRLADDASKLLELNYAGESDVKMGLNSKMYLGAEYNMPFYKNLSVGVLYAQCFSPFESKRWNETRGFVNLALLKWLELSANYGYGTYGSSLGWMLNFHPAGINLFVGSDYMITKVTPQYIPVDNMNAHVTFGLSFALGKRK